MAPILTAAYSEAMMVGYADDILWLSKDSGSSVLILLDLLGKYKNIYQATKLAHFRI